MTMPSKDELIENMANAIVMRPNTMNPRGNKLTKGTPRYVMALGDAKAALNALVSSLPNDTKDIETQARNMQMQCIRDNPTAGTVPSVYHYEQQLQHLDKSAEHYKQLLNYKD